MAKMIVRLVNAETGCASESGFKLLACDIEDDILYLRDMKTKVQTYIILI